MGKPRVFYQYVGDIFPRGNYSVPDLSEMSKANPNTQSFNVNTLRARVDRAGGSGCKIDDSIFEAIKECNKNTRKKISLDGKMVNFRYAVSIGIYNHEELSEILEANDGKLTRELIGANLEESKREAIKKPKAMNVKKENIEEGGLMNDLFKMFKPTCT